MSDDESIKYKVTLDGKEIPFTERFKGTLEIPLSIADNEIHTLTVE